VVAFYRLDTRVFYTPNFEKPLMSGGCVRGSFKYIHSRRDHFDPFIASQEAILTQMASAVDRQYLPSCP
jgi:hypothetical protein